LFTFRPNFNFLLGTHKFENIAKLLDEITEEFSLHGKASYIVTDNGSNFVKAFKEFSVSLQLSFA
jgi:hypothetical protein